MAPHESIESEVKSWLEVVLKGENLKNLSITVDGNSEKGDGYMGDIVFVTAIGTQQDNSTKRYNLVLKCSKRSQTLRDNFPVKEAFLNEAFLYDTILPYFFQFQQEKGVKNPFKSTPKFYGTFISETMEVLVFENLKSIGYELYPKKQPLTRKHINLVVTEYGKFHATSVALKYQRPDEFQKFVKYIENASRELMKGETMESMLGKTVDQTIKLLKNDLDEEVLQRWSNLKKQAKYIFEDMILNVPGMKVILHGDCWNNNFMYLHKQDEEKTPLNVAFLDWQISRYSSPIIDLSYFLLACISEEDLQDLDEILKLYHDSFINQLEELGVENPHEVYPLKELHNDWKLYSRFGVMMAALLMKVVSTEKDEVVDLGEIADSGMDLAEGFLNDIRDKDNYRRRIRPIVEYTVRSNFV